MARAVAAAHLDREGLLAWAASRSGLAPPRQRLGRRPRPGRVPRDRSRAVRRILRLAQPGKRYAPRGGGRSARGAAETPLPGLTQDPAGRRDLAPWRGCFRPVHTPEHLVYVSEYIELYQYLDAIFTREIRPLFEAVRLRREAFAEVSQRPRPIRARRIATRPGRQASRRRPQDGLRSRWMRTRTAPCAHGAARAGSDSGPAEDQAKAGGAIGRKDRGRPRGPRRAAINT